MSTRSAIIIQDAPRKFRGIYCHFDGYPSHVGKILADHYRDRAKVSQLIALGQISILAPNVSPDRSHSFGSPQPEVVVAYGRDRGEKDVGFVVGTTCHEVQDQIGHNGYVYLFGLDNKWTCNEKPIAEAIDEYLHQ